MKRVLILASVASMIDQFNMPNIKLLQDMGYAVDVACNFEEGNTCSEERIEDLKRRLKKLDVRFYQVDFARNVVKLEKNIRAFWQVKSLLSKNNYAFLHCHSPIGGVVGRVAGRITHTKVVYTAHGFHFYRGAPIINWLIYYPIELFCSKFTDVLITINSEDFELSKSKMYAKRVEYLPGVGIDIKRFAIEKEKARQERSEIRKNLGIADNEIIFFSVGELNANKNHSSVVRALGEMTRRDGRHKFYYLIAGIGKLEAKIKEIADMYGISDRVSLLAFRNDIEALYRAADVFILPSVREGLCVALMEAMAAGLPCLVSKIRGNVDLIDEGEGGFFFNAKDINGIKESIDKIMHVNRRNMGVHNRRKIEKFESGEVLNKEKNMYKIIDMR